MPILKLCHKALKAAALLGVMWYESNLKSCIDGILEIMQYIFFLQPAKLLVFKNINSLAVFHFSSILKDVRIIYFLVLFSQSK